MMPTNKLPKQYITVSELAKLWEIEVADLFLSASVGELVIGVRDYGANHLKLPPVGGMPPEYEGDPKECEFVGVLSMEEDDLEQLGSHGEVWINVAYLHRLWGKEVVIFDQPRKVTIADAVVPMDTIEKHGNQKISKEFGFPDGLMGDKAKTTLLKQIGGLALVIANKGNNYKWGNSINKKAIADAVQNTLEEMPQDLSEKLSTHGLSQANLRANITTGLKLLEKE